MEMDEGKEAGGGGAGDGGWGMGESIQWAEIDRDRKRWIVEGRKTVRDSAGYIIS